MDVAAIRNLKDFLSVYNQMAEMCFSRCVGPLSQLNLTAAEEKCADTCAAKFLNINHKMMAVYMEAQALMINKRQEEMAKLLTEQNPPAPVEPTTAVEPTAIEVENSGSS
ncbi:mitochondrial import inner membrane translocase, subunit [Chamberlinius hualienensis]